MEVPLLFHAADQSSRQETVVLDLDVTPAENAASSGSGRRLQVRLTQPNDPCFFYSLLLTEDDFQALKTQQGLLVDFHAFPQMTRQLAEQCVRAATQTPAPNAPNFQLVLDARPGGMGSAGAAVLSVQETNPFRRLCHLSLKMSAGSDQQVKTYLSSCLKRLQLESTEAERQGRERVQKLEAEAELRQRELRERETELARLREANREQSGATRAEWERQLAGEKERAAKQITDLQARYDQERRCQADSHARALRLLENRVATLDYENKDLTEKRHRLESMNQRYNEQGQMQKDDASRTKRELEKTKAELAQVEAKYRELEKRFNQIQAQVPMLEQDNLRLRSDQSRQRELLSSLNEQKIRLEQDLVEKEKLVTRRETAVKNVSQELLKANEIIKKFQNQVKAEHQKVKLSARVLEEQEKVLSAKDDELNTVREELKKSLESGRAASEARAEAEAEQKRLRDEKEAVEKKLKTNETVIHWLNKQLTVAQARDPGLRLAPPPEGLNTFTPSGMGAASTPLNGEDIARARRQNTNSSQDESIQHRLGSKEKENNPVVTGLDERYFQPSLPASGAGVEAKVKGLLRQQNSSSRPTSVLPSNLRTKSSNPATSTARGGLLRRPLQTGAAKSPQNQPPIDSVYFPKT